MTAAVTAVGLLAGLVAVLGAAPAAHAELHPAESTLTIEPGGTDIEPTTVRLPERPVEVDILIAIDNSSSMGWVIEQAKAEATNLVDGVLDEFAGAHFAVVQFSDTDDPVEYGVNQAMTNDAADVQAAIDTIPLLFGGDYPEAYNRVFHEAHNPSVGGDIGWRSGSRKFVVVIGDAPPHDADIHGFPECDTFDSAPDPHGFDAAAELEGLAAADRTLMMVAADPTILPCYEALAASGFAGSQAAEIGADLASQILGLVEDATATVSDVELAVAAASPAPAGPEWLTFTSPLSGPFTPPTDVPFIVTVDVPEGTPAATYTFTIVGTADGATVGEQTLTVAVPEVADEPVASRLTAEPAVADVVFEWVRLKVTAKVNVTLQATLHRADTGGPLPGEMVRFMVGTTEACRARTNDAGVARCGGASGAVRAAVGLGYRAVYDGGDAFGPSRSGGTLVKVGSVRVV